MWLHTTKRIFIYHKFCYDRNFFYRIVVLSGGIIATLENLQCYRACDNKAKQNTQLKK